MTRHGKLSPMAKKPFTPIPPMAELPPAEEIDVRDILDRYLTGEIDLICVLGPTASGKTRYAVHLARQINALLSDGWQGDCGQRGPCHPRHGSGGTASEAQWWGERSERPRHHPLSPEYKNSRPKGPAEYEYSSKGLLSWSKHHLNEILLCKNCLKHSLDILSCN